MCLHEVVETYVKPVKGIKTGYKMYLLYNNSPDCIINHDFRPSKSEYKTIHANDRKPYEPGFHIIDNKDDAFEMATKDSEFSIFEVLYDDVVAIGFERMNNIVSCYANAETLIACSIARKMKIVSCIHRSVKYDEEDEYEDF